MVYTFKNYDISLIIVRDERQLDVGAVGHGLDTASSGKASIARSESGDLLYNGNKGVRYEAKTDCGAIQYIKWEIIYVTYANCLYLIFGV